MGGALIAGWRRGDAVAADDIWIQDPFPGATAERAAEEGARLNPDTVDLIGARTVVLALKPQAWEPVARDLAPSIAPDAVIISIMAGVRARDLSAVFPGRPIARVMPNMAASIGKGAAGVWAPTTEARVHAHTLFSPLGVVVDLETESQIHAVTGAAGSAPAYVFALVEALEAAGLKAGLSGEAAKALSRATLTGAAALLEDSGQGADELRRQVTSPGGTTEAALSVLIGEGALDDLVARAVLAAMARSRQLGGE